MNVAKVIKNDYGLDVDSFEKINFGVINDNYLVKSEGKSYLFKVYNLDNEEKVKFEIDICTKLLKQDFPSPRLIKNLRGAYQGGKERPYILLDYIPGKMLGSINQEQVMEVGELMGKLHRGLMDHQQEIEITTWEPWDIERMIFEESDVVLKRDFHDKDNFVEYIKNEYSKLDLNSDLPYGMTHQDIKPENIIMGEDGRISFIDFNNCYRGVLLYDVMTFVIWALFPESGGLDFDLFKDYLRGYDRERKFEQVEFDNIIEALKFRLIREAYVWPYRWLNVGKAKENAWRFVENYKNIVKREIEYKKSLENIWEN